MVGLQLEAEPVRLPFRLLHVRVRCTHDAATDARMTRARVLEEALPRRDRPVNGERVLAREIPVEDGVEEK